MTPLVVVAVALAAAAGIFALARAADSVVRPLPGRPARSVPDTELEHEQLAIPSGAHRLTGWLMSSAPGASEGPLLVMAHGWGASHGTVLQLAEPLVGAGHQVLLFDMRGHGWNEPLPYVTVRHFRDDVMSVLRWASERAPGRPIVLVGHSFGGAASVLAAAEGARLDGLVLIATPADVVGITAEYLTDKGLPGGLMTTVMRPFWWWRLGSTFRPHNPVLRIRELNVPILLIQPEDDDRVRRSHADRLSAAAGVPVRIVPGREHTDVLAAPETQRLVLDFLETLSATSGRSG